MTDKIKKFLAKLSAKDLQVVRDLSARVLASDLGGLNVVQLKGTANTFRARKGKFRVIYSVDKDGQVEILSVTRRDEKTYKDF